jgi:hypothetical protein
VFQWVLQGCYRGVKRVYKGVIRVVQGLYKGVTRVLQGCYKGTQLLALGPPLLSQKPCYVVLCYVGL